jgi:hypothetical protein
MLLVALNISLISAGRLLMNYREAICQRSTLDPTKLVRLDLMEEPRSTYARIWSVRGELCGRRRGRVVTARRPALMITRDNFFNVASCSGRAYFRL